MADPITRHTRYENLPEFLTVDECRAYLALSRSAIYDMLRRGVIPHRRFGRILRIHRSALLEAPTTGNGGYGH